MGIGIDWHILLAQLVNFIILFGLLAFLLYRPILRMLNERSNRIKESMEQAEQIKQRMTQAEEEVRAQLEAARRDGQNIIAEAGRMGDSLKEEARVEARQEAQALIARYRVEIARERDEAIEELRRQFVDLAILAAEKVINETLDREKHRRLIDEVLEEGPKGRG